MDYRDDRENYGASGEQLRRDRSRTKKRTSPQMQKRLKKKEKAEKRHEVMKNIFTGAAVVAVICVIIGAGISVGMYAAVSTEMTDMNLNDLTLNHRSVLMYTDQNGNAKELDTLESTLNRKWVASEDISDNLKMAAIAIEDERFEKHNGVDIKRTIGATVKYALSKIGIGESDYGGSTITQQVIKNITNEKEKSSTRKIKEMMRAIALEKTMSKDEILTMYLNIIYLANNCYGVEAASNMYFDKSADELSIAEAATIVGITQRPAKYDPYAHPEDNKKKRDTVLMKMHELEFITDEEYEKALDTPLKVVPKRSNYAKQINSYFVDQVVNDVISDLQSIKGYSAEFAEQQLTNGGLTVYTTADPDIQEAMEEVFENTSNFPNASAQAAMVIIDPYTGEVKGMVGGMGKKNSVRGLNRATQSFRQPGSAIKPLSVYAPAIDQGEIDQGTVVKDEPITIGSDDWEPSNSYKGFKGNMTVREAVGRSSNIPAVKVLDMIGINKSYSYLEGNFRLSSLQSADKNYSSLALGGLTKGVSVEEMAAAYAVFVNGGKYSKPITYTKVVDSDGNVILENKIESSYALKASTAFITADLLREPVNSSYGTATRAKLSNVRTYGKTGTTNDNIDKWFVGFTPYYVGAVWYGYDTPKSVGGSNPSVSAWKKVMEKVHAGLEDKALDVPSGVVEVEMCTKSGKLAKSSCPSETAYFLSGKQPKKTCTGHSTGLSTEEPDEDDATEKPDSSASPSASATPKASSTAEATEKATEKPTEKAPANTPEPPAATKVPVMEDE